MGPPRLARDYVSSASQNFSVGVSLAGIEPVGFRVKSDSRNHQAIVQPRLYDSLMVTRITLLVLRWRQGRELLSGAFASGKRDPRGDDQHRSAY